MVIRLGKSSWDVFVEPPMGPPCLSGLGLVKSRTRAERGKEEIQTLAFFVCRPSSITFTSEIRLLKDGPEHWYWKQEGQERKEREMRGEGRKRQERKGKNE